MDDFVGLKGVLAVAWAPDGRRVAYQLGGVTGSEIRVTDLVAGTTITVARDLPNDRMYYDRPDLQWTGDGERLLYRVRTSYYSVAATGDAVRRVFGGDTVTRNLVQLSPDGTAVSYAAGGELWVQPLGDSSPPRRLSTGEELMRTPTQFLRRFLTEWPLWSPDGRHIAFMGLPRAKSGAKVGILHVATGQMTWVEHDTTDSWTGAVLTWAPDSRRLAIARQSADQHRKTLVVADVVTGRASAPLWVDTDSQFVSQNNSPGLGVAWAPDGRRLALLSNRDGWTHLYVIKADDSAADHAVKRLTKGRFEVQWVSWLPSGNQLVVLSNHQGQLQQRLLWRVDFERRVVPLVDGPGFATAPRVSPDGRRVLFGFTTPDDFAQVRVAETNVASRSRVLYSTVGDGFPLSALAELRAVTFPSADGAAVPAVLLTPRHLDQRTPHPAIVHMYGGWGQLAVLGRLSGDKPRLFEYLVSRGFVVLIVDPRGSEAYGAAWARGLYADAAGKQSDDVIAGARYLRSLPYIDTAAITLYGHSYGGYLTLATMLKDSSAFNAGIPQAGDFDYEKMGYTLAYARIRFGGGPGEPALIEERGRPALHVNRLTAPLLVVHGTADYNVSYSDSEWLVRNLMQAGKPFEFMTYPNEPHNLQTAEAVRDFFLRVERFVKRLREDSAPAATTAR